MRRVLIPLLLSCSALLPSLVQATPDVLRVASGHQPMAALEALADQYQLQTGNKVLLIEGDSRELAGDIGDGMPFDLFFADDGAASVQALHAKGRGEAPLAYACAPQAQYVQVLVEGPRRELAERFFDYLKTQPEALAKAGFHFERCDH
ncbi:substrate-binding domain-containing protein [Pseudomonas citronellolis]|uniref:substrate-binding domain-containing protein n=1 Tax=Pseudomonas citronellolis TaxID=53408 RepID=UPI0023E3CFB4|nr:substrate-binding domain-containing protein [Pseudomonas citronellolis]MDF3937171.1 substrate-binding domain-containing protein [Pseudomonas citronellolis]